MKRSTLLKSVIAATVLTFIMSAWRTNAAEELRQKAERAINNLKSSDSTLTNFFECSAGYAVFPDVRRSGTTGKPVRGVVYEKYKVVGEATLLEPKLKSQDNTTCFHEAIFFESTESLENFMQGRFVMSRDIGAISSVEGAALTAGYQKGVVVFAVPKSGKLEPITIADQEFTYVPLNESPTKMTRAKEDR